VSASEALAERLRAADLPHVVLNARQDKLEAEIVEAAGNPGKITVATNMAGRGTDIRLGPGVADLGGLHVILTEFHESSRIDRQLFGRAGRQGDPGTFEAIVSLDDEIFVRFAKRLTETFASLLNDRPGPLPRRLGDFLRRIAQYSAEAYNFKTRQETMRRNKQLDKAMESAGISE
jgi:preprotein translocase subunit SecA